MMTQEEYEQKKIKCWEEFKNAAFNGETSYSTYNALDFAFDYAYALGKKTNTIMQEEIRKVAVEYAEENIWYPGETSYESDINDMTESFADAFESDANFVLSKQGKNAYTVISGWVVRDEDANCPRFYNHKPFRKKDGFKDGLWSYGMEIGLTLDPTLFPDLTWDSDPEEVEIIIKRKKNE